MTTVARETAPLNPKALPNVSSRYGAPMGRGSDRVPEDAQEWTEEVAPRSVRVASAPLDSGGYDTGGAYWGTPWNLFLVQWQGLDVDGTAGEWCRTFVRGASRAAVIDALQIPPTCLYRRG